ncbi:hypothetical protein C8E00_108113 [Chromohalobacter marismortui]|uniref:Lipoprotein n=1 Tax=Chromohalobacter marismortui TaxID=42055 RepID=A0A4R7NFL3_9GAMM|nr:MULTISPECIES: hypothetical protein [Chromohalobacter]MCI0509451.1 hypothetical protein [Chromohalobacter sp.]MCI0593072.1 hypothetical protein [Chromohalobacter sp.]TDU19324.1 hypothetical protein C8E00_108113 [Chromohalobacter marismortui]
MKVFGIFILGIFLVGCATTTPKVAWVSTTNTDEFTDVKTCSVTVGSLYTRKSVFTYSNHYYPYIEVVDGDLRVGIKSGGKHSIPVGDVQMRIDDNKAWTISSSETPLDYIPKGTINNMEEYTKNLPEKNRQLVEATYKRSMKTAARAMSPFTATTGKKAKNILREMLSGTKIKYRTLGLNQAASTTGEYSLDSSLEESLVKCGIQL